MKAYTDLEQSKKLAEILSIESADCYWDYDKMQKFHRISWFEDGFNKESQLRLNENNICAWSLAALLEVIRNNGRYELQMYEGGCYFEANGFMTESYFNPIDTCYEMILDLHKLKLL